MESREVKSKMLGVLVTPTFHKKVADNCKKHDVKMSGFLRTAIEVALKKMK